MIFAAPKMNFYNSGEMSVEKAFKSVQNGKYEQAIELYRDAVAKFSQYKQKAPRDEEQSCDMLIDSVKEEMRAVQQILDSFKVSARPRIQVETDSDDVQDSPDQVRRSPAVRDAVRRNYAHDAKMNTPSRWNVNAAKPRYQPPSKVSANAPKDREPFSNK